jgi:hypothetical protein
LANGSVSEIITCMNSHLKHRLILAVLALFAAAFLLHAGDDAKRLVGKWNMVSVTSDGGNVNWVLIIKEVDGKLTGSLASEDGETSTKDFSFVDGVVKFQAPYQGEYYNVELKLADGRLTGTWSNGGGDSGKTSGTKA